MCEDKSVWIFVYGTLKKGGVLYTGLERMMKKDSIVGTLWGRGDVPYPFLKLERQEEGDSLVHGELHLIGSKLLKMYDRIEGEMYKRRVIITESGVPAQVYEFIPPVNSLGLRIIKSGRF